MTPTLSSQRSKMRTYHSKYHARKVFTEEGEFDSQGEYKRWRELKLLEKAGVIKNLQRQVTYELLPKQEYKGKTIRSVKYVADFVYEQDGEEVVEDFKGARTDLYLLKKKLMLWRHGIMIRET